MLSIILSIFLLFPNVSDQTVIEWLTPTLHEFGDLKQGKPVTHDFRFKNTGTEPMIIDNVRPSCGCTGVDWEDQVIEPGAEGVVKIEFNAKHPGYFYKKITVFFNTQRKGEKLFIEGYVE